MARVIETVRTWLAAVRRSQPSESTPRPRPEMLLNRHAGELMRMRGVLSVGIGRDELGRPVIVIGLDAEWSDAQTALPTSIDGVPVHIRTSGRIRAR